MAKEMALISTNTYVREKLSYCRDRRVDINLHAQKNSARPITGQGTITLNNYGGGLTMSHRLISKVLPYSLLLTFKVMRNK